MGQNSYNPPPQVHVVRHPIVQHMLAEVRDRTTPPPAFRNLLRRTGGLLAYEALRGAASHDDHIDTPLETATVLKLDRPITIVPILRAGLGLGDGMIELLPEARTGHIGLFRDEQSLEAISYYEKLPPNVADSVVLLVDPMLATGGSASAGLKKLRDHGCGDVRFVCLVAAPEGIEHLTTADPRVPIFTAAIDRQLNDRGYILPGLGDAGDRQFGTE